MSFYQFLYILAAAGFILALKWMSLPGHRAPRRLSPEKQACSSPSSAH